MNTNQIDAQLLAKMFLAGAKSLEAKKEWINELNVFPVPDGDTGTNMSMTIMAAAKEVASLNATNDITMESLCKAISSGSLRGARGNSGVILSQLFRGFTKVAKTKETLNAADIAEAFVKAVETAYKAVMKPKEGTILTVAKGMSEKACELVEEGATELEPFFASVFAYGEEVLAKTPDMLPVLKQAGVVDSGGQGLIEVLRGCMDGYLGKEINLDIPVAAKAPASGTPSAEVQAEANIKFGYCTEFIILLNKVFNIKMEMDFKAYLESIGDSIVVVADDDVVKVHVHTNDPGLAIQRALKYGALSNMKIDNMRLEHQEKLFKEAEKAEVAAASSAPVTPHKEVGFIAVSAGEGINEIFVSLGVDFIIQGGQTMNPSTEDMLNAIDQVNADTVFILPNNKNIILAANQAKMLVEDKKIVVIPTKTIPQGITAVISYVPDMSAEENEAAMVEEISRVKTGQVTYAVRDTMIDDKAIKQGDYMGIGDAGILSVGTDIEAVTLEMTSHMVDEDTELVSVYYGEDIAEEAAEVFREKMEEVFPDVDIEMQAGNQPIYYYIVSAE